MPRSKGFVMPPEHRKAIAEAQRLRHAQRKLADQPPLHTLTQAPTSVTKVPCLKLEITAMQFHLEPDPLEYQSLVPSEAIPLDKITLHELKPKTKTKPKQKAPR